MDEAVLFNEKILGQRLLVFEFERSESLPVVEGSVGEASQAVRLCAGKRERSVVGLDRLLDVFDREVRKVAVRLLLLPGEAVEVVVLAAVTAA